MSMEVDLSTPLTGEERAYLHMRGRIQDIQRADEMFGRPEDAHLYETGDGTAPDTVPATFAENVADRRRRLLMELDALGPAEDEDGTDEELPPYEEWLVKDLDAELKNRDLPVTGDKPAKVKALRDNDAANAE